MLLLCFAAIMTCGDVVASKAEQQDLSCEIGPLKRVYGGNHWLVYGCSDQRSIVVVADAGNPAQPFFFFFTPEGSAFRLYGEGSGAKSATESAFKQLSQLEPEEIRELFNQARLAAK